MQSNPILRLLLVTYQIGKFQNVITYSVLEFWEILSLVAKMVKPKCSYKNKYKVAIRMRKKIKVWCLAHNLWVKSRSKECL